MSIYKKYKTDNKLEDEGNWVCKAPGVFFKIRRYRSAAVQDVKKTIEKPYEDLLKRGEELGEEVSRQLLVEQVARGIVTDWKGVTHPETDEILPFTVENALKVFGDLIDLTLELINDANDRDNFKNVSNAVAAKN